MDAMRNESEELRSSFTSTLKSFRNFLSDLGLEPDDRPLLLRSEFFVENLKDWNIFHNISTLKAWYNNLVEDPIMQVEKIPLNSLSKWGFDYDTGDFGHKSGTFFKIKGLEVSNSHHRELQGDKWQQPIIEEKNPDAGILGLLRKRFDDIPHYLVQAKEEPGNYNICQLSPTLQATLSNMNQDHGGREPFFADYFDPDQTHEDIKILRSNWITEDGGRFFQKRNYAMLIELDKNVELELPDRYRWFSLYQIKHLNKNHSFINPFIRSVISLV